MPPLYSDDLDPRRDSLELASLASSSPGAAMAETDSRPSIPSSRRSSLERDGRLENDNAAAAGRYYSARPNRSLSVSSTFDFAANLFPLTSTTMGGGYAPLGASTSSAGVRGTGGFLGAGPALERHKTLTYLNGLSLVVGLVIGSGIFSSPSQVNVNAGSPGASLIIWLVAGILAWTGAASYAELGGAIPLNGGSQAYLSKIFGELWGFLFTWVAVLVLKPGSAAIISIIMGEYLVRAAIGAEAETINPWINKTVALAGLVLVTLLNCVSTWLGTRLNDSLMFLKFVALLGVAVAGVVVAITGYSFSGPASLDWKTHEWFGGTKVDASAWALALYAGLWAFDGWDNTNYVVGEFRNPSRDLPRVIHTAMPLVIISYMLANLAYFFVLPLDAINASNTVAVLFGAKVFGPVGSLVLALIVSASCLGALNSSTFTSSRIVYVASKEGYIPAYFGRIGLAGQSGRGASDDGSQRVASMMGGSDDPAAQRGRWLARHAARLFGDEDTGLFFTPISALVLNGLMTVAYILIGEFSTLLTFYGVAGYTFYFLTVLGLIVLRVREPQLERPYRAWITTPIIFCCVSLFLLSRAVFSQPLQALGVVVFLVAGVPIYYCRIRGRDRARVGGGRGRGTRVRRDKMRPGMEMVENGDKRAPTFRWWRIWRTG